MCACAHACMCVCMCIHPPDHSCENNLIFSLYNTCYIVDGSGLSNEVRHELLSKKSKVMLC